jgi:predicted nucleotidyltransferase
MLTDPRLRTIIARQPYPLLFVTVSGAHLYGFPSPDSDYDLRGVHILPVAAVVDLDPSQETMQ